MKPRTPKPHRAERRLIICRECGEARPHKARGLCQSCYSQFYRRAHRRACPRCGRTGLVSPGRQTCEACYRADRRRRPIVCAGCGKVRPPHARGLCQHCYDAARFPNRVVIGKRIFIQCRRAADRLGIGTARFVNEAVEKVLLDRGLISNRPYRRRDPSTPPAPPPVGYRCARPHAEAGHA